MQKYHQSDWLIRTEYLFVFSIAEEKSSGGNVIVKTNQAAGNQHNKRVHKN